MPLSETTAAFHTRTGRAVLASFAATVVAVAPESAPSWLSEPRLATALAAGSLAVAALLHRPDRVWTRLLATAGLLVWTAGSLYSAADNPGRGLFLLITSVLFLATVWPSDVLRRRAIAEEAVGADRAVWVSAAIATWVGIEHWQHGSSAPVALSVVLALPVVFAAITGVFRDKLEWAGVALCALIAALPALSSLPGVGLPSPAGVLSPLCLMALLVQRRVRDDLHTDRPGADRPWIDIILARPSRVVVVSFVALCAVGTVLLSLPSASTSPDGLSWLDAAFTAVSASCVTGLIVVDTPTAFGGFGQLVVLGLIQVGGLGIMVFSAAAIVLIGQRMSLVHESAAVDVLQASGRSGLVQAVRNVVLVTFLTEGVAALLLSVRFALDGDSLAMAVWRGVFTAVSAFCNAGFALQTDSLVPYSDSPFVLGVTGLTIVVGGLGPAVVVAVTHWRRVRRLGLHARLVLWTTAVLLVVPALLITIVEWNGAMATLPWWDKLTNGVFQSVTLRTAGFNSIDLTQLGTATWTLMVLVMFVGGSPGSTAGGVKTTTMAVLVLTMVAIIRGRDRVTALGRTIPTVAILRAVAVSLLGVFAIATALTALMLVRPMPLDVGLFEVVSALATVGLSIGGTAQLDEVGKLIIIACMFAGRVGPLTLLVFFSATDSEPDRRRYPEQPVPIG